MTEKKNPAAKDSIQTVRFTSEEAQQLREFLAATNQKFQSFAMSLIRDAVQSGKTSITNSDNQAVAQTDHQKTGPEPLPYGLNERPSTKEIPWLRRTLAILRSPKPGLPSALKSNLLQFEDTDHDWQALQSLPIPHTPGARDEGGPRREHPDPAAVAGRRTSVDALLARVDQTLDEIEEAQKDDGKKAGRAPRKIS